jgi:hypothetical protein
MAAVEKEHQDRHQQQDAARQGIEEELDRRVHPVRAAPHADDEVHGDEHGFPEHIEQDEIERREDA